MSAEIILAILNSLLGAAPEILALFNQAKSGSTVTATQVSTILSNYDLDRSVFAALIAAKTEAAPPKTSG